MEDDPVPHPSTDRKQSYFNYGNPDYMTCCCCHIEQMTWAIGVLYTIVAVLTIPLVLPTIVFMGIAVCIFLALLKRDHKFMKRALILQLVSFVVLIAIEVGLAIYLIAKMTSEGREVKDELGRHDRLLDEDDGEDDEDSGDDLLYFVIIGVALIALIIFTAMSYYFHRVMRRFGVYLSDQQTSFSSRYADAPEIVVKTVPDEASKGEKKPTGRKFSIMSKRKQSLKAKVSFEPVDEPGKMTTVMNTKYKIKVPVVTHTTKADMPTMETAEPVNEELGNLTSAQIIALMAYNAERVDRH